MPVTHAEVRDDDIGERLIVETRTMSSYVYIRSECGPFSLCYGLSPNEARAVATSLMAAANLVELAKAAPFPPGGEPG